MPVYLLINWYCSLLVFYLNVWMWNRGGMANPNQDETGWRQIFEVKAVRMSVFTFVWYDNQKVSRGGEAEMIHICQKMNLYHLIWTIRWRRCIDKKRITPKDYPLFYIIKPFFRLLKSADFFQRFVCFVNGCCTLGEEFFFFSCQFQFNDLFDTVLTQDNRTPMQRSDSPYSPSR